MNESGAEYPLFLSAVSYSVFAVLKISSLDELSDSRLLIEVGICLIIDGEWFDVLIFCSGACAVLDM